MLFAWLKFKPSEDRGVLEVGVTCFESDCSNAIFKLGS